MTFFSEKKSVALSISFKSAGNTKKEAIKTRLGANGIGIQVQVSNDNKSCDWISVIEHPRDRAPIT